MSVVELRVMENVTTRGNTPPPDFSIKGAFIALFGSMSKVLDIPEDDPLFCQAVMNGVLDMVPDHYKKHSREGLARALLKAMHGYLSKNADEAEAGSLTKKIAAAQGTKTTAHTRPIHNAEGALHALMQYTAMQLHRAEHGLAGDATLRLDPTSAQQSPNDGGTVAHTLLPNDPPPLEQHPAQVLLASLRLNGLGEEGGRCVETALCKALRERTHSPSNDESLHRLAEEVTVKLVAEISDNIPGVDTNFLFKRKSLDVIAKKLRLALCPPTPPMPNQRTILANWKVQQGRLEKMLATHTTPGFEYNVPLAGMRIFLKRTAKSEESHSLQCSIDPYDLWDPGRHMRRLHAGTDHGIPPLEREVARLRSQFVEEKSLSQEGRMRWNIACAALSAVGTSLTDLYIRGQTDKEDGSPPEKRTAPAMLLSGRLTGPARVREVTPGNMFANVPEKITPSTMPGILTDVFRTRGDLQRFHKDRRTIEHPHLIQFVGEAMEAALRSQALFDSARLHRRPPSSRYLTPNPESSGRSSR